jgi:hypothetical protein
VTAQTTPSKLERARLAVDIADMTGCDIVVAEQAITEVLRVYEVHQAPLPSGRLIRLARALKRAGS